MAVPAATRKLIEGSRDWAIEPISNLDDEHECQGARFHSPTPLLTYPYALGPGSVRRIAPDGTEVWLCGTCLDNLTVYVRLQRATGNDLPWDVRREFGNLIRALGDRAWSERS